MNSYLIEFNDEIIDENNNRYLDQEMVITKIFHTDKSQIHNDSHTRTDENDNRCKTDYIDRKKPEKCSGG